MYVAISRGVNVQNVRFRSPLVLEKMTLDLDDYNAFMDDMRVIINHSRQYVDDNINTLVY